MPRCFSKSHLSSTVTLLVEMQMHRRRSRAVPQAGRVYARNYCKLVQYADSNLLTLDWRPLHAVTARPIPPVSIFQLLQGGWPANLVLRTVVGSVNGLRNALAGVASDPRFDELSDALTRIQRAGNIGIRVEPGRAGGGIVAVIGARKAALS